MQNNTSPQWKKRGTRQALLRNALLKSMGYTDLDIEKPIIGVINTWAETNPGHLLFRQLAEAVKRGVWAEGGFPLEVNTLSICEVFFDISSMVYRNLLSITTEELIARHPFDGVVLIGGCDKNVPAQLMAAASANKPAIYLPGGAMLPGNHMGEPLACGTDSFKLWTRYQAGELTLEQITCREGDLYGSPGACPIMGTANSSQAMAEAIGMALPGSASPLAVSSERLRISELTGRRAVHLVEEDLKPLDVITLSSLQNAIRVITASGGSTNLIIHLTAIARRSGIPLDLMEFDRISRGTPLLVNVKPHGQHTVGLGFHNAGGVRALMKELLPLLNGDCRTVTGSTVAENLADVDEPYDRAVIAPLTSPLAATGGLAVVKGNLAPNGAVIKTSAASKRLLRHSGEARVFDSLEQAEAYLLSEDSDMDEDKVIVLRGYGPKGAPGMPEFGNYLPVPPKLYRRGITDFLRITDARMSGGAFGTVVLHVAPEAAVCGPLAAVRDGDRIELDAECNRLQLLVSDEELQRRLDQARPKTHPDLSRGFVRHFVDSVLQADQGCDMDYL